MYFIVYSLHRHFFCWSTSLWSSLVFWYTLWCGKRKTIGIRNPLLFGKWQQPWPTAFGRIQLVGYPPSSNTVTLSYKWKFRLGFPYPTNVRFFVVVLLSGDETSQHPRARQTPRPILRSFIISCHFPPSNGENSPSWNLWRCTENHLQSPTFQATVGSRLVVSSYGFKFQILELQSGPKNHKHFFGFQNSLPEFTELIYYHSKGYQRMKL